MREPPIPNQPRPRHITRLAPSPTGALHLGNAFAFVINWALARKHNWRIILRIEDLDYTRVRPGVIERTIETLSWLGLDWDQPHTIQSGEMARYRSAMDRLAAAGRIYPCELSRSQIENAASAPHDDDPHRAGEARFDPALRPRAIPDAFDDSGSNWRFMVDPGAVRFDDALYGPQSFDLDDRSGDFVVWTKRSTPSYQLAVVVDDDASGVTQVVRGRDLLESAARQILLSGALGIDHPPAYTHLPLVRGADGRRLAKRHGDPRVDAYAQQGTAPEKIIGLIGFWAGLGPQRAPMPLAEFMERFSLDTLAAHDIVFTPEDDAWLRS